MHPLDAGDLVAPFSHRLDGYGYALQGSPARYVNRKDLAEELSERHAPAVHDRLETAVEQFGGEILTRREREVVRLLLRGHSVKSTAGVLDLAPGTVKIHRRNIYAKLGISSQSQLFSRFFDFLSPER